tara:strand:- start:1594 stop:2337 length:744 start_codon:yes stop_codon:yes gene_type:complete
MKTIVNKVTITGADDSIKPQELIGMSDIYPFVEWGILLSKSSEGKNRFPSLEWMEELQGVTRDWKDNYISNPNLSGHICGRWVRDICKGEWSFITDRPSICQMFDRFQLNFHAQLHKLDREKFLIPLNGVCVNYAKQLIFQMDDVNNDILDIARQRTVDAVPLFDISGGKGILPEEWPQARNMYCGYAGGLSPDNIEEQMEKIEKVAGDGPIWVDVETHVRSDDDKLFDMDKVEMFLHRISPWVKGA